MNSAFLNLTPDNLAGEHLCCIIRTKTAHPGVEAKRAWLAARLAEGHVFRKLNTRDCAFIEYAPLESHRRQQLPLHLLPLGAGRAQGARLWAAADGILPA